MNLRNSGYRSGSCRMCGCGSPLSFMLSIGFAIVSVGICGCGEREDERGALPQTDQVDEGLLRTLATSPLPFRRPEWEFAVADYMSSDVGEEEGVVKLLGDRAGLTVDGSMYVTRGHSCGALFLFATWRGKGSNLQGYLYCFTREDTSGLINPGTIEIMGPRPSRTGGPHYSKIDVRIEKTDRLGWYRVSRDSD